MESSSSASNPLAWQKISIDSQKLLDVLSNHSRQRYMEPLLPNWSSRIEMQGFERPQHTASANGRRSKPTARSSLARDPRRVQTCFALLRELKLRHVRARAHHRVIQPEHKLDIDDNVCRVKSTFVIQDTSTAMLAIAVSPDNQNLTAFVRSTLDLTLSYALLCNQVFMQTSGYIQRHCSSHWMSLKCWMSLQAEIHKTFKRHCCELMST